MHPALSVILFTTAAGAGYGLLFWLGLLAPLGLLPLSAAFGLTTAGVALALFTIGLLSSTAHLGHPERAWRAITQWRTSWLSREGVVALATYVPAVLFPLLWLLQGKPGPVGYVAAAACALTVICTGMIYASLKPIRQWHHPLVVPVYLLASAFTGGACLAAIAMFWQGNHIAAYGSMVLALATLIAKLAYWRGIDRGTGARTPADAIGLARLGKVRMLDPPNTEENYLLREMGYRIARKHAAKLRIIALVLGFVVPIVLLPLFAPVAAAAALVGVAVERWLFFAEATHTVTLYYGRAA
jgi:DMSO reductase anchor subunit